MNNLAKAFDEGLFGRVLDALVHEGPGLLGRTLGKATDIAGVALGSVGEGFSRVASVSLGSPVSGGSDTSARVQEPVIAQASPSCQHEFDPAGLGCLSPSALPTATNRNAGMVGLS